jgi:hypothetical protein
MALTDNLQAFYKLSDLSDSSGNNRTLTNNGNVSFASGKLGNAAFFDGSNNLKSSLVVPYSTSDVTLSLWLKAPATSQWRTFFGSAFNTGVARINYGINDADQIFINDAGNGGPVLTLSNYTVDDTWQHIVAVVTNSGDSVKFYRAGNLVDEITGAALGSTEVWIGGGVGYPVEADFFNGQIDAVGIWNRALSDAEVAELYNNGTGLELDPPNYRGEWDNFTDYGQDDVVSVSGVYWKLTGLGGWTVGGAPGLGYGWTLLGFIPSAVRISGNAKFQGNVKFA